MDELSSAIGRSIPRIDGRPKVTGQVRFAADIDRRGLLHARPVLALPAHAFIDRIDRVAALAVPGVVAILTAADLPIVATGNERMHEPLARHEILWAGQPVALVVAETVEAAADAAALVVVETTPLAAVVDIDLAIQPGAPRARIERAPVVVGASAESQHAAVGGGAEAFTPDEPVSDNVVRQSGFRRGDVEAAMADSDLVVEGRFTTSWVHQGYIEPQVAMASFDDDGALHITSATQGTFFTRSELSRLFGLPIAGVRVTGATIGGGFGGKTLVVDPLVAGAALALRRPVRLELTRHEDMRMTNPAPGATLDVRIGAMTDGRLRAVSARVQFETGAFAENSIEGIAAILLLGPYRWDAHHVVAYGVETNRAGTGAYRAPGAPQATFALEQLIDELARRLEIDPIELRRRNLIGRTARWPTATPGARSASRRASIASRPIRSIASAAPSPTARGSGWRSGPGPVVGSRPPRSAASRRTAG